MGLAHREHRMERTVKRKSLYRPMNDEERQKRDAGPSTTFEDEPKVRPAKPPKGAKRKAKR